MGQAIQRVAELLRRAMVRAAAEDGTALEEAREGAYDRWQHEAHVDEAWMKWTCTTIDASPCIS